MGLEPGGEEPSIETVHAALKALARPLFLGRNCCLPSQPVLAGKVKVNDVAEALCRGATGERRRWIATTPADAWPEEGGRQLDLHDMRNWLAWTHEGTRRLAEGPIADLNKRLEETGCT